MDRIQTKFGEIKLIASNLEKLCINGFVISSLGKTEEYVDKIPTLNEDVLKKIIEEILEKNNFVEGKEVEFNIDCIKADYGEEIVAFWKICFEITKYYRSKFKKLRLAKLCYVNSNGNIPFKIEGADVLIKVGKKWMVVPISIYSTVTTESKNLSIFFTFLECRLKAIFR